MLGAIIGAGASLIGGALDRKSQKDGIRDQNAYNNPKAQRKRLEAAGFNPAPFMGGAGAGLQTSVAVPTMGNAIANAGALITQGMEQASEVELRETALNLEKERFEEQKKEIAKLNVGGVYTRAPAMGAATSTDMVKTAAPGDGIRRAVIAPPARPSNNSNPNMLPGVTDPMGETRPDGSTGANRENPAEAEADLWFWASEGTIRDNAVRLYEKNFGPTPYKKVTGAGDAAREKIVEKFNDMYRPPVNPHPTAKPPKIDFPSWADPSNITR